MSAATLLPTIRGMSKKKPQPASAQPPADRAKPMRMVRIPEPFAVALETMAEAQFNTLTEQIKIALREYLERNNALPKPGA